MSSVGDWPPFLIWRYPERSSAGVTWHGAVPNPQPPSWANITDAAMPYLCLVGKYEWAEHWRVYVRPGLLKWRKRGWLTSMVVGYQVGHVEYPEDRFMTQDLMIDYMAKFVDRAVEARVPRDTFPTNGPIVLEQIDPSTGYLPSTDIEAMFQKATTRPDTIILPYNDVPENERENMFWTFDKEMAVDWVHLHHGFSGDYYCYHGTASAWNSAGPLTHGTSADTDLPILSHDVDSTCTPGRQLCTSAADGRFAVDLPLDDIAMDHGLCGRAHYHLFRRGSNSDRDRSDIFVAYRVLSGLVHRLESGSQTNTRGFPKIENTSGHWLRGKI